MDKYDEAVAYFKTHRDEIYDAWVEPFKYKYGYLFKFASPTGHESYKDRTYGCVTLIKCGWMKAYTEDLTNRIRADNRLPTVIIKNATDDHLEAIAEWQRTIDKELGRE